MPASTCGAKGKAVSIYNVRFNNIFGTSTGPQGVQLDCSNAVPCRKLIFQNVRITPSQPSNHLLPKIENAFGMALSGVYPGPLYYNLKQAPSNVAMLATKLSGLDQCGGQ